MILQSMTSFVLEQKEKYNRENEPHMWDYLKLNFKYAEFLEKSLTIDMFLPVDEEGNVLEEPSDYDYYVSDNEQYFNGDVDECKKYVEAKNRVLFECKFLSVSEEEEYEISINGTECVFCRGNILLVRSIAQNIDQLERDFRRYNRRVKLTESALKKIGLIED